MKFTKKIKWKRFDGTETQILVSDCDALQEVDKTATQLAVKFGWTPPKWWQWWRWSEH